ncbi:hypothetical protein Poli38472_014426 [Pythium oligandrum]|uniref:Uncharacterized protein n=1 Tax=Pythium oligandrum TaxID=41045 RepID=A0A8K1FGI8_PYTOL|nr:hypothetical protein Poli38472_014426 [Pythium oligandrum]|eukprot:TMW57823.1 hypothetical protein Poli38472_014426 [Pythium oligandrum]
MSEVLSVSSGSSVHYSDEDQDQDEAYASERFEAESFIVDEDPLDGSTVKSVVAALNDETGAEDGDEYGDETFDQEDEQDASQNLARVVVLPDRASTEPPADDHVDYSNDWDQDDENVVDTSINPRNNEPQVSGDELVLQGESLRESVKDVKSSDPSMPLVSCAVWCEHKLHELRHKRGVSLQQQRERESAHSNVEIPGDLVESMLQRAKSKLQGQVRTIKAKSRQGSHAETRVPTALVDRARVKHLVNLQCPPCTPEKPRERRGLSMFSSDKVARLEGKLATLRLHDMSARWHHSGVSMSIGTMDLLADVMKAQNRLHAESYAFASLRSQATNIDRAIAVSQLAIEDSQALREVASRVLTAQDAVVCECFGAA